MKKDWNVAVVNSSYEVRNALHAAALPLPLQGTAKLFCGSAEYWSHTRLESQAFTDCISHLRA